MQLRGRQTGFVRTEGGLLPPDLLERVRALDRMLPGLDEAAYGLAKGERFGEAITRSWNELVGHWARFREELVNVPPSEPGTTTTRERFLLPLMEQLGYGRLSPIRAVELEGKSYPVSHAYGAAVPLHLVGAHVTLDGRTRGVAGAAGQSPHGLLQELLNRSPDRLWGMVTNGRTLRILRDNASLTRQAYVEFDLEAIFAGEAYADFALLWYLAHGTRLEPRVPDKADEGSEARPEACYLETWSKVAEETGARARDRLRDGVQAAIEALGRGFLAHPDNLDLRAVLRTGELTTQDYYHELLRLVYRLILLFVAEDRDLLLDPNAPPTVRDRYGRYYSTGRLRRLAERRKGTRHADLYSGLRLVMDALGRRDGAPGIGLAPLGGFLFGPAACPHLDVVQLANVDLLDAIRELTTIEERGVRRVVDYRNLGSEELGSIYESLLELHPSVDVDAPSFALATATGHERKTTGSYYTPTSLIGVLLDSALDRVLAEIADKPTKEDAEAAILEMSVVDPAAGSGHFLVAAAHRIAKRLAQVRTGDDEPSPTATRTALRDAIARCLYAVDVNPMAVELCKVSLWLEALEPGKPLTFLDHHIKCGNSLLGATPDLVAAGIPDAAYAPITGDDTIITRAWRDRNRGEREGQQTLFEARLTIPTDVLAAEARALDAIPDDTAEAIAGKAVSYAAFETSSDYRRSRAALDAWCAAFVVPKITGRPEITTTVVRHLATDPTGVSASIAEVVEGTAREYGLFHWPIEFPAVFARGGFDIVIGNPPWGQVELKEKEWFAGPRPDIASAGATARQRMIERVQTEDPALFARWRHAARHSEGERHLLADSGSFPLTGRGRINTYAVFAELMRRILSPTGRVATILQSGIAMDDTTKEFFADVVASKGLVSFHDFENQEGLFPAVHREQRFCLMTMTGTARPWESAEFVFFAHSTTDLTDPDRRIRLSSQDLALINPNTRTCPIFRTARDANLVKQIYHRTPVLVDESLGVDLNPWKVYFRQGMFNMTADAGRFRSHADLRDANTLIGGAVFEGPHGQFLPLLEGKLTQTYNHRFATFDGAAQDAIDKGNPRESTRAELAERTFAATPRYWVAASDVRANAWLTPGLLTFHGIANPNNEDTAVFTVVPPFGIGHSLLLMLGLDSRSALLMCALGNSRVFDYLVRVKSGSRFLSFFIVKQLPVPSPQALAEWAPLIVRAALELTYTADDLRDFARDVGWLGPPFRWDAERRSSLIAELDAMFFHLYGLSHDDAAFVLDQFPITQRNDVSLYGEYRTKRVVLERLSSIASCVAAGRKYEMLVDPPPGDSRAAHPPRPGEAPGIWLPRSEVVDRSPFDRSPRAEPVADGAAHRWAPTPRRPSRRVVAAAPVEDAALTLDFPSAPARDDGRWLPETSVDPAAVVLGTQVRHRAFGAGTVLGLDASGRSAQLLIRFDTSGEKWIAFGYGLLEFRS